MNAWKTTWNFSILFYPISNCYWAHSFLDNDGLSLVAPLCLLIYALLKLYENTAETSFLKVLLDFRTVLFFTVSILQKLHKFTSLTFFTVNHGIIGWYRSFRLTLDLVFHVLGGSTSLARIYLLKPVDKIHFMTLLSQSNLVFCVCIIKYKYRKTLLVFVFLRRNEIFLKISHIACKSIS